MNIRYYIRPPLIGNQFPAELPISELEEKMQEAFATRSMVVVNDYFIQGSDSYPQNLLFFVFGRDRNNGNNLVSGLIATKEEVKDFKFTYYDKIFVVPDYEGNGLMKTMIKLAREISYDNKTIWPAILRTSGSKLDKIYSELRDVRAEIGDYFIHGFGFLDKETKEELFKGANDKFYMAAKYIALKPKIVVPVEASISLPAP